MTDLSELRFFATPPHPCSYLPGESATTVFLDPAAPLDQARYSALSRLGFRRSGVHLYRPHCTQCTACIPLRVVAEAFRPHRRHRRVLKRNADLTLREVPARATDEHYALYARYITERHRDGDMFPPTRDQFESFLLSAWAEPRCLELRLGTRLLGAAITDRLDDGLAAVYTYFDPEEKDRSLGTFAILNQLAWCRREALPYLYLGYWIRRADKMRYKHEYQPCELRLGERWVSLGRPQGTTP
jgi:arginyl-tRNA--protein-N-Asp/Glu arginylyltransferase